MQKDNFFTLLYQITCFQRIHKSILTLRTCISLLPVLIFRMQITLSQGTQVEALLPSKRPAQAVCPAQIRAAAPGVKYCRKSPCAPQPNLHNTVMSVVCTPEEPKKETINYSPVDEGLRRVCVCVCVHVHENRTEWKEQSGWKCAHGCEKRRWGKNRAVYERGRL